MNDSVRPPLFADIRRDFASLGAELRDMAAARWQLARLELQADFRAALRLTLAWFIAAVLVLVSLPLVAVCLASALAGCYGIAYAGWLSIFAAVLLLLAILVGGLAWRRFRHQFTGLRETLEELREDLLWLQEKTGHREN